MKRRELLSIPLIGGGAMFLGACSGVGKDAPNAPGASASVGAADANQINVQDVANLAPGGTLRLTVSDIQDQWNSSHAEGNTADTGDMLSPCTPTYFFYDAVAKPIWNPDYLAEEPKAEGNPLVVEYKLNPKAIWNDGTPITAADFIATWKALNGSNKEFLAASTAGFDQITSVEQGDDEFHVIMKYKSTYPDWTVVFSGVLRADSVKDPKTFNEGWKANLDVNWLSGPFVPTTVDPKAQVVVSANPKWWGAKPVLESITFKLILDISAVPNAYVNKEIDVFDIGADADAFAKAKGVSGGEIRKAAGPNWRQFTFNTKAGNVTDQAVRQAIVMGLDRGKVATSDLAGIDWPAKPLNNIVFMENQVGYVDLAEKTGITFDVEKAKKTLDDAGWVVPEGSADGIREKDGKKLTVTFSQLAGVKASENEALQLQSQMKPIGIDVKILTVPSQDFNKNLVAHQFEIMAFSWLGGVAPMNGLTQLWGTGSENNFAQTELPEVDELIKQIDVEMDNQKRIDLANQMGEKVWTYVHTLPLYQRPELVACGAKLANFGAFGFQSTDWTKVGFMK